MDLGLQGSRQRAHKPRRRALSDQGDWPLNLGGWLHRMVLRFAAATFFPSAGKDTAHGRGKRQSAEDGDSRGGARRCGHGGIPHGKADGRIDERPGQPPGECSQIVFGPRKPDDPRRDVDDRLNPNRQVGQGNDDPPAFLDVVHRPLRSLCVGPLPRSASKAARRLSAGDRHPSAVAPDSVDEVRSRRNEQRQREEDERERPRRREFADALEHVQIVTQTSLRHYREGTGLNVAVAEESMRRLQASPPVSQRNHCGRACSLP